MTFFVIFVSVPAFLFGCVALVHFQREIVKSEEPGSVITRKVSIDGLAGVNSESGCDTHSSKKHTQVEVYQLEGAYLGPLFVVRNVKSRDWQLINTGGEYHRVLSASRG